MLGRKYMFGGKYVQIIVFVFFTQQVGGQELFEEHTKLVHICDWRCYKAKCITFKTLNCE